MAGSGSSQESAYRRRARDLAAIATTRILEGRGYEAALLAWGSDLEVLQECVHHELIDVRGESPADYYAALEQAFAFGDGSVVAPPAANATAGREQARAIALERLRPLAGDLAPRWEDIPGLSGVPDPSGESAARFVASRLEGRSLADFARHRQESAQREMNSALLARVKGETVSAIEQAYSADVAATEAYLADSAAAGGDTLLLTLVCRWELVLRALGRLDGLPGDFAAALQRVRDTIASALSPADAERLRKRLPAISPR